MAEIIPVYCHINTAAGSSVGVTFHPGRKFELVGVRFGARTAITAHASNIGVVSIYGSDETTAVWQWDTTTGNDGTVAASTVYYTSNEEAPGVAGDTAKDFEAAATKSLLTYDGDQLLEVVNDQSGGSGVAFVDAGLTLLIRYL